MGGKGGKGRGNSTYYFEHSLTQQQSSGTAHVSVIDNANNIVSVTRYDMTWEGGGGGRGRDYVKTPGILLL